MQDKAILTLADYQEIEARANAMRSTYILSLFSRIARIFKTNAAPTGQTI